MPQSRSTKRLTRDRLGMKVLITTTSLAVTLGGWAVLAASQPKTSTTDVPITDSVVLQPLASSFELNLAPLPTIAAAPPPPPKIVVLSPPVMPAIQHATHRPQIQVASQPAAEPAPVAAPQAAPAAPPQPDPAAPPAVSLPPLRVVSAPPKPVARTRSSR